jgi:SulP family sulfate permease
VLFVIKYSGVDVVRATFSGTAHRSNVDRSTEAKNLIDVNGDMIEVLRLDGFLFFGSTNSLLDRIRERAGTSSKLPLKYLVLDFSAVSGIDSSAVASFFKLGLLATKVDFKIVFTRISAAISRQLQSAGLWEEDQPAWKIFDTLEYGIEWFPAIAKRSPVSREEDAFGNGRGRSRILPCTSPNRRRRDRTAFRHL